MLNWLSKTVGAIKTIAPERRSVILKEELEDILLEADVEYDLVEIIMRELPSSKVKRDQLRSKLLVTLTWAKYEMPQHTTPFVDLIVGVNGAGKTTTISKLAKRYLNEGKKVLLGASDTFRAAAIEQLSLWAKRLEVPIVATKQGHDPSAVAYDAIESARAKGVDHVIIDTAGRLHTQKNLASELQKIVRICDKAHEGAPHRKMLIIDGTQGNSAISQARAFHEMIDIDGIIITKLDGTAKGGAVFSIAYALRLPILFIGVGEKPEDLIVFDKYEFVDGFLDAIFDDDGSATFASQSSSQSQTEESDAPESVQGPTLEQISRLHAMEGEDKKSLITRLGSDGFDLTSRHFVRDRNTWEDYRLHINEAQCSWELLKKDGTLLKSYPLEA